MYIIPIKGIGGINMKYVAPEIQDAPKEMAATEVIIYLPA